MPNLTFQAERWTDAIGEMYPLMQENWRETGIDIFELDCDRKLYEENEQKGTLHITTARDGGRLAGYYINFVVPHPHYKSTLFAMMDIFYLERAARRGTNGLGLFLAMEEMMLDLGVQALIANSKIIKDTSPLFERLGWSKVALCYMKILRRAA